MRCSQFSDLQMGVNDKAVMVLALGLIFTDLMVPCQAAESTSLLSMLEARSSKSNSLKKIDSAFRVYWTLHTPKKSDRLKTR